MDKFANEDNSRCDAPEYVAVQAGIDDVKETDVFVIATVNEICKLPDSLRRSGRFDRKIGVWTPTAADAEAIIAHYLSRKRVSDDINMKDLTKMMSYHSCAELETILNEAAIRAAFARKDSIGMEDMVGMVLKQQYGASEDVPHNSEEAVKKAALHEAGHLVACEILSPGSVGFASLLPSRENRCGGFVHNCNVCCPIPVKRSLRWPVKPPWRCSIRGSSQWAAAETSSARSTASVSRPPMWERWDFLCLMLKVNPLSVCPKA